MGFSFKTVIGYLHLVCFVFAYDNKSESKFWVHILFFFVIFYFFNFFFFFRFD